VSSGQDCNAYPFIKESPGRDSAGLVITSSLSADSVRFLEGGGRVLLLADKSLFERSGDATFFPASGGALGTVIPEHIAFEGFPNEGFCDLQFYNLLEGAYPYSLDAWPKEIVPMVGGIWTTTGFLSKTKNLSRVGYVLEAKVGKGKLLVSTLRIRENFDEAYPEVVTVFDRLLRYAISREFDPRFEMTQEQLRRFRVQ